MALVSAAPLAKLHDPALQSGRYNLTVEYIVYHAEWVQDARRQLDALSADLEELSKAVRGARNKLLAHNDLDAILSQSTLGAFDDLVPNDIEHLMAVIGKGSA